MKTVGFIGCGNMGSAIIGGVIRKELVPAENIFVADVMADKVQALGKKLGITPASSNNEVVQRSDVIVLAVKPQYYAQVIHGIAGEDLTGKIFISITPGKTVAWLGEQFGKPVKLVRTMPNTPAMVGEGITAVVFGEGLTDADKADVLSLLSSFSKTEEIPEHLMDAVTSVSGSSPAYVYMFIEAMADEAVAEGMPRPQAYRFAAQAVLGSAKMVLETGKHPGELKDMVCSPAGTTIEAVRVLEEKGFRSSVIEAMRACYQKSKSM